MGLLSTNCIILKHKYLYVFMKEKGHWCYWLCCMYMHIIYSSLFL